MKAIALTEPHSLRLLNVQQPLRTPNEVLVRITNGGICGTDLKIYEGEIPVQYPLIMGHEIVGELQDGEVDQLGIGQRVLIDPFIFCGKCAHCFAGRTHLCPGGTLLGRDINGGFCELIAVPRSHVFALPEGIESSEAPLIQVLTTCLHAQRLVEILPGQSVAIVGLGVTGQLHLQLAKARGVAPLIGITRSVWKRQLADRYGASLTLPNEQQSKQAVDDATSGLGADIVIETTGQICNIALAISMVRSGGTLVLFGITTATEGSLPFYQLYFKEIKINDSRAAKPEDYPAAIRLVERGTIDLKPLVTDVVPLTELEQAIRLLQMQGDQRLKITILNN
jgi:L-iditol 2-dehydrogenase